MNKRTTPPPAELKRNNGFTLAEVLITLVIIGVIAAITIPTLMANARRQEASARLKKAFSTLSQASIKAKSMGNDWEEWADSASGSSEVDKSDSVEAFAKQYLLPYLNYTDTASEGSRYYIYLADGSYFSLWKGGCIDFFYDVNGPKKPNIEARDLFRFLYCPYSNTGGFRNGKISPYIYASTKTREQALTQCKNSAPTCSGLLAIDNWEFKKDYPYNI